MSDEIIESETGVNDDVEIVDNVQSDVADQEHPIVQNDDNVIGENETEQPVDIETESESESEIESETESESDDNLEEVVNIFSESGSESGIALDSELLNNCYSELQLVNQQLFRINQQNDFMIALIVTIVFVAVCYKILNYFIK